MRAWLLVDLLLVATVGYYFLPEWAGEMRARILSRDYWYARWQGEMPSVVDGVLWRGDTSHPIIALTFDDGPDPATTPRVLEILRKEGVRATFFVVGIKLKRYPELARQIVREGHALGCHSYDHQRQTDLTEEQVWRQIRDCQVLAQRAKVRFVAFRPPYLAENEAVRRAAARWRLPVVMATTLGEPGQPQRSNRWVYRYARRAQNGCILLLHDTYPHTVEALPELIRVLRERGFEFVTIPEMIERMRHGPAKP
ncbi:MAG: polysaccharide deacetylase family protein [Fimbriimonadales bacterium]|nr:polysaccharide deacetylase family protein [Fimbriimonadales bacterium]MDW8052615.1 polysaccharide deacetylase family protein [Armatimonadota bacterium]